MACDPNTLLEQAKCLNACIPQAMMPAVEVSLLCQIAAAGGGGAGEFVLKSGDTMTGELTISVAGGGNALLVQGVADSFFSYQFGSFEVFDAGANQMFQVDGSTAPGKIGFFGASALEQVSGANLTNNVTVGGVNDTIADFTSLTVYATDAAAIRNDIYQLARKLKQINDGLRAYGLFT